MGPYLDNIFIVSQQVLVMSMAEWSAWSGVFLTLAQSKIIPHLQRRHSV